MMHGLILAGGEGSRLRASGVTAPKALVEVGGVAQLNRMVVACRRVGCISVTCAVREDLVEAAIASLADPTVHVVGVRTPTSLHTLVEGLAAVPAGDVLCALVDTVMPAADWDRAHSAVTRALAEADAAVAVTSYVADENPLWVDASPGGFVNAFGVRGARDLVTGGVYWLSPRAREEADRAVRDGVMRLRGFLARLAADGLRVMIVEVAKIVDIDTDVDLQDAMALVLGEQA